MSKAFDTVNLHRLVNKLLQTSTPAYLVKFISNYIKGRQAYTNYFNHLSKKRLIKTGVPQGGVLSPILFNLYTSDLPTPPQGVSVTSYADDITPLSSHHSINSAASQIQPYLNDIHKWTIENDLKLNPDKCGLTLFTSCTQELSAKANKPSLTINNIQIPIVKTPKILGLTFDPTLTFKDHVQNTITKAKGALKLIKAISSKSWGKQKETLLASYNAIVGPHLE